MHDGLGQELSGIQRLVGQTLDTTRSISRGLELANPHSGGLRAALQQLASDLASSYGLRIGFDAPVNALLQVPEPAAEALFHMSQQARTDACVRGGASTITFVVTEAERGTHVRIRYPLHAARDAGPHGAARAAPQPGHHGERRMTPAAPPHAEFVPLRDQS